MNEPIRILHIVGIMNMGGLENFIMNLYRSIDKDIIQFDFLVTREDDGIFDNEIKSLGGNIYNIPKMEKIGYKKYTELLKLFFEDSNYKIIHCHRNTLSTIYLKQAKKVGISTRIVHSHSTKFIEKNNFMGKLRSMIRNFSKSNISKYATHYFACSDAAGKWLFGKNSENKFKVIQNGINADKYSFNLEVRNKIRKDLNVDESTFLIGHVGRFDTVKNHRFIVELAKILNISIENFKFCLVGDGALRSVIENEIAVNNLQDKFIVAGIKDNINEVMMGFDLFILPSLFEGFPVVLVEAQSSGLNCLISNNISYEVDLGLNLIEFIDINDSKLFIESILKHIDIRYDNRLSTIEHINKCGYNINTVSTYLQEFYLERSKE